MDFDKILVRDDWFVREKTAPVFTRVYYVLGGKVLYRDENTSFFLKENHLYLFPTSIPYSMEQEEGNRLYCLFMHLDIAPNVIREPVDFDCSSDPIVSHIVQAIDSAIQLGKKEGEALILHLSDALIAHARQLGFVSANYSGLDQAVEYIAAHYTEEITVEDMSAMCGYHEKYFIHIFKSAFGLSPHQYLMHYRLKRSCYLLKEGMSVTEAAYGCGYKEAKTYCRAFREMFGISPGTYGRSKLILP